MSSIDSAASNAPSPRPDREEGRFSTRASHLLIGKPPPSDLPNVPQNGLRFATAFGFQNIGDQVVNAKTTLPWFLNMVGAPAWIAPLLVPIRESGSMLPQAALRPWIQSRRSRLPILLAGTFGQALGCVISVCATLFTTGMAAGLLILLGLTVLALSRSLVSLTSKDIQGRTMPKGYRGRVTGFATTLSGAVAIVMGLIITALRDSLSPHNLRNSFRCRGRGVGCQHGVVPRDQRASRRRIRPFGAAWNLRRHRSRRRARRMGARPR